MTNWGLPRCKNLSYFFFVLLVCALVWLLFNSLLALLLSLGYVIHDFDRFFYDKDEPQFVEPKSSQSKEKGRPGLC